MGRQELPNVVEERGNDCIIRTSYLELESEIDRPAKKGRFYQLLPLNARTVSYVPSVR